jgi:hypothetical protein
VQVAVVCYLHRVSEYATCTDQDFVSDLCRRSARYMYLRGGPITELGNAFVARLIGDILTKGLPPQRPSSVSKLNRAVGAMIADLLLASASGHWSRRKLDVHSFDIGDVKLTMFRRSRDALERAGLMCSIPGYPVRLPDVAGERERMPRLQTCFVPTDSLHRMASDFGILPKDYDKHFSEKRK